MASASAAAILWRPVGVCNRVSGCRGRRGVAKLQHDVDGSFSIPFHPSPSRPVCVRARVPDAFPVGWLCIQSADGRRLVIHWSVATHRCLDCVCVCVCVCVTVYFFATKSPGTVLLRSPFCMSDIMLRISQRRCVQTAQNLL